jgi:DNA modification methylase
MIINGDARSLPLADESVQCCVTSPPYWGLRDYGVAGQIGLERTPEEYVAVMVAVFREVRRVLKPDGVCWLNLGDSYAGSWGNYGGQNRGHGKQRSITTGSQAPNPAYDGLESWRPPTTDIPGLKPKDLVGIPWRVAFALQADGWWLRSDIIWAKPNPMPESVTDRPTRSHEYLFLLTKSARYYYDAAAIAEESIGLPAPTWLERKTMGEGPRRSFSQNAPTGCHRVGGGTTRNRRTVWTIATQPSKDAHFAVFPEALVEPCILAGSRPGDTVLDPFGGSGTAAAVADRFGRIGICMDINAEYLSMARRRLERQPMALPAEAWRE